jgi:hypothetical protein
MLGDAMNEERSMTDENADAWAMIAPMHQMQRLTDWANMLEARVKEFDPEYRAYPWGRDALPASRLNARFDHMNIENRDAFAINISEAH